MLIPNTMKTTTATPSGGRSHRPLGGMKTCVDHLKSTWCSDDSVATIDFLLPTGIMVPMMVEVNRPLIDIKADLWKEAQRYPLYKLLRPMNQYCFSCITHMAEKVELLEENKPLTEVRPFIPMLKVIDKRGQTAQKIVDAQISSLIGRSLTELDNLEEPEVVHFRRTMRIRCEKLRQLKQNQSKIDKLSYLAPSHLSDHTLLSPAVKAKLLPNNCCQIIISSCSPKINLTLSVCLDDTPVDLIRQTLTKLDIRSAITNGDDPRSYLLKVWMRDEYLLGDRPLSQYNYIRRCILKNTKPKLLLISKDEIVVDADEKNYYTGGNKKVAPPPPIPAHPVGYTAPPTIRTNSVLTHRNTCVGSLGIVAQLPTLQPPQLPPKTKRSKSTSQLDTGIIEAEQFSLDNNNYSTNNNKSTLSLLDIEDTEVTSLLHCLYEYTQNFSFTLHTASNITSIQEFSNISLRACLYHGGETISNTVNSKPFVLDPQNTSHWGSETMVMSIQLRDLPRMARLCFMLFATAIAGKKSKKDNIPLAWVNMSLFDYKGRLRTQRHQLHMWSYGNDDCFSQETGLNPIGTLSTNPTKHSAVILDLTLDNYNLGTDIVYPSLDKILELAAENTIFKNDSCLINVHESSNLRTSILNTLKRTEMTLNHNSIYQLEQILDKDPLSPLHEQEKEIIWLLRFECHRFRKSLTRLVISTNWSNRHDVAQLQVILQTWPIMDPCDALELLDHAYADIYVRRYAMRCLRNISDVKLNEYLLQLVQMLKYENYLTCDLTDFLLERALNNRRIGHFLFWLLKSEMHVSSISLRFGLILEVYCRNNLPHLRVLTQQQQALHKLKKLNDLVKNHRIRKKAIEEMQMLLKKDIYLIPLTNLTSILDPAITLGNIRQEGCTYMESAKRPLWLCWCTEDAHLELHQTLLMYKSGDDLRQDMLTLQIIRIMDGIWQETGLDFRLSIYGCIMTGDCEGLIEVVPNAETVSNIQKKYNAAITSAFCKRSIYNWLKENNPTEESLNRAIEEFTMSCAGYCVATYVLGIKDRHCGNIMVKKNGQMFHIDFGHFLGHSKYKFGVKRERVPFVLTNDFIYVIQGGETVVEGNFDRFMSLCERAYLALRAKSSFLLSLFMMMLNTGIPELSSIQDIEYIRHALLVDHTEEEAKIHFREKLQNAIKLSWVTMVNNVFQNVR